MKNIHILPTEKPSRLYYNGTSYKDPNSTMAMDWFISSAGYKPQNIYITSEEEIKEGDYYITILDNEIFKADSSTIRIMNDANKSSDTTYKNTHFKIILTDNQDLIKDGVQAINDEFLEWFVKNPSCKEVETLKVWWSNNTYSYDIIVPKEEQTSCACGANTSCQCEEPKQETLDEAAESYTIDFATWSAFKLGAKWQSERTCKHIYTLTSEQGQRVIKCSKCNDTQPI